MKQKTKSLRRLGDPQILLATWFGSGLLPKAPGTWGSLIALPFAWGLHLTTGWIGLAIATLVVFIVGTWASVGYLRKIGGDDPAAVVIDEVAGQWLTLIPAAYLMPYSPDYLVYAVGFVLFRLTDILKPWPASWADRTIKGALGVMVDDILAALFSVVGVAVWILYLDQYLDNFIHVS